MIICWLLPGNQRFYRNIASYQRGMITIDHGVVHDERDH